VVANVITAEDGVGDVLGRSEVIFRGDAVRAQIDIQILELDRPDAGDRRLDTAAGGPPDLRVESWATAPTIGAFVCLLSSQR
jgi:hypothetical protein